MVQFYVPLFLAAVLVVVFCHRIGGSLSMCRPQAAGGRLDDCLDCVDCADALTGLLIRALRKDLRWCRITRQACRQRDRQDLVDGQGQEEAYANQPSSTVTSRQFRQCCARAWPGGRESSGFGGSRSDRLHNFLDHIIDAADRMLNKLGLPTLPAADVHTYVHEKLTQAAAPLALGGVRVWSVR